MNIYQDKQKSRITNSLPLSIPEPVIKHSSETCVEYNLKQNFFNPDKSSPPNYWQLRLEQRLDNYYDLEKKWENLATK